MNTPGTSSGNWQWRMLPGEASAELAKKIYDMTVMYSRTERRAEETAEEETAAEAKSF